MGQQIQAQDYSHSQRRRHAHKVDIMVEVRGGKEMAETGPPAIIGLAIIPQPFKQSGRWVGNDVTIMQYPVYKKEIELGGVLIQARHLNTVDG